MRLIEEIKADMKRAEDEYRTADAIKFLHEMLAAEAENIRMWNAIPLGRRQEICNAERDGRCVVLPCKVGDEVWVIENVFNGKEVVQMLGNRIVDGINHNKLNKNTMISQQPFEVHFFPSEIGRTVFLTQEAAEAALKGANHE